VRVTDQPTPRAWQVMEVDGRRTQVFRVPGPTLGVQLARRWDVLPASYQAARWFHWGIHPGEDGSLTFARELIEKGRRVSLEPFKPPDQPLDDDTLRAMLAACAVFSPNWIEAVRLVQSDDYATILTRLHALGAHTLAIRRGPEGADVWDLDAGRGVHVPAVQADAVDVVGAGNTFCGALVARLDEGIASAACHASVAASYMIEQVGMPAAPPDPADYARRVDEVQAGLRELKR
jgi:sugar/nucleoside kinase (ribokinase family)